MKKLLNTLYILQENAFASLDGECIVVTVEGTPSFRLPFCNLESVVCFNYMGMSPALMGKCAQYGISVCFLKPSGKFLARVTGAVVGSVHLRRAQYEQFRLEERCLPYVKSTISTKLHNARCLLARLIRDHKEQIDVPAVECAIDILAKNIDSVFLAEDTARIRGIEGSSAKTYFAVFEQAILKNKDIFTFSGRTKRPPLDCVNAMLSYFYSIVTMDVQSALETVGLDPYIGFFHTDRAGRPSLASDLTEELRAYLVDRHVLSMINLQQVSQEDFVFVENGAVIMTDDCRKKMLRAWQERKRVLITHEVIKEKIPIGLIPYVQAQLLAKTIRKEINEYPAFVWR